MLAKTLKYDFKNTWKYFAILYGAVIVLTIIAKVLIEFSYSVGSSAMVGYGMAGSPMTPSDVQNMMASTFDTFSVLAVLGYLAVLSLAPILTFVIIIVRFYKNLYSNEGYLTNTLPVSSSTLLWSKIIMGLTWAFLGVIVCTVTAALMFIGHGTSFGDFFEFISDTFFDDPEYVPVFWFLTANAFIGAALTVLTSYTCASIGQLFTKHRIMAAVLLFAAAGVLYSFLISVFFSMLLAMTSSVTGVWPLYVLLGGIICIDLIICAVEVGLNSWILGSRLNLE